MEVRKGFKQTEIGILPDDWAVGQLEELCTKTGLVRGPFGGSLKKEFFVSTGYKVYEQRNAIYRNIEIGSYFIDKDKYEELKRFAISESDFIVSCSGTIGKIYQIPKGAREGVINQALLKITLEKEKIFDRFFYFYFDWEKFQERIIDNTQGGAMKNLVGMDVFRTISIPIPPLPEQQAIAAALSDVDALLTSLDALIAKKRLIKQGAMQELLTGEKRLPGFSGEWKVKSLGDLFDFSGGFTASRDQLSSEGYCYLHYGDIHKSNKTYVDVSAEFQDIPKLNVSLKKISEVSLLKDGDVVFVDASEDDEGASKHVVINNPDGVPFISGLHTIVAKSKTEELANLYRRYCFQTRAVKNQFLFYAVGTKVTGISKSNIAKINLPVPSLPEQNAIAEILSDMDAEISALESRREKTRLLKVGMMQELLTGRIRLV